MKPENSGTKVGLWWNYGGAVVGLKGDYRGTIVGDAGRALLQRVWLISTSGQFQLTQRATSTRLRVYVTFECFSVEYGSI